MAQYTVHFTTTSSCSVTVEADDKDAALDLAYDELPAGICAQCSGWGQTWTKDEGDEWEAYEICDAAGNAVWEKESRA